MVNLTRIYTRTGDAGRTRLGDMSETSKTDLRLEAYACVDEGNAHIGVALAHGDLPDDVVGQLAGGQDDTDVGVRLVHVGVGLQPQVGRGGLAHVAEAGGAGVAGAGVDAREVDHAPSVGVWQRGSASP